MTSKSCPNCDSHHSKVVLLRILFLFFSVIADVLHQYDPTTPYITINMSMKAVMRISILNFSCLSSSSCWMNLHLIDCLHHGECPAVVSILLFVPPTVHGTLSNTHHSLCRSRLKLAMLVSKPVTFKCYLSTWHDRPGWVTCSTFSVLLSSQVVFSSFFVVCAAWRHTSRSLTPLRLLRRSSLFCLLKVWVDDVQESCSHPCEPYCVCHVYCCVSAFSMTTTLLWWLSFPNTNRFFPYVRLLLVFDCLHYESGLIPVIISQEHTLRLFPVRCGMSPRSVWLRQEMLLCLLYSRAPPSCPCCSCSPEACVLLLPSGSLSWCPHPWPPLRSAVEPSKFSVCLDRHLRDGGCHDPSRFHMPSGHLLGGAFVENLLSGSIDDAFLSDDIWSRFLKLTLSDGLLPKALTSHHGKW